MGTVRLMGRVERQRADTLLQVHRAHANRTAAQNEPSKAKRKVAHVASHVVLK